MYGLLNFFGVVVISVGDSKRDWQALERKISKGIGLEKAAEDAGIPLEEVYARISNGLKQVDTLNWQLRLVAQRSLEKSLDKLTELAEGEYRLGKHLESTDLLAAQSLAKIAIESLKLATRGQAPRPPGGEGSPDLFDKRDDPFDLRKGT